MALHSSPTTRRSSRLITAILCLSGTVVALQQTMVIPLLPDFPKILGVSADDASWLVTVTLLTSAVATPIVSRLADMFGKRRMMLISMTMIVVGSLVAAIGGNFVALLIGRGLQGFAISMIPVGISIMRDELPKEKVASATALMSATLGIGSALGLPLSGLIFEHLGWPAIFWLSAIVGVLLIIAVAVVVPESSVRTRGKFDFLGAVMLSTALTAILLAISKGARWGWTSELTLLMFVIGIVTLALWFPYELRVTQPMVDLRTSAKRPVLLTNVASILVGFSMYANNLSTTQQLQMPKISGYGFELGVMAAGLCMIPAGLAMVFFAPVSANITKRFGAKITLIVGGTVLALAYIARVFLTGSIALIIISAAVVSIGTAIAYSAMPMLIMRSVPITETASANGLNSLLRSVGTSTSSAVGAAMLTSMVIPAGRAGPSVDRRLQEHLLAGRPRRRGCCRCRCVHSSPRRKTGSGTSPGDPGRVRASRRRRVRNGNCGCRACGPGRQPTDPAGRCHRDGHGGATDRLESRRQRGQLLPRPTPAGTWWSRAPTVGPRDHR